MTDTGGTSVASDRPRAEGDRLRVLLLTAYPAIGGPLPKLAPLMVDGLRESGCDVLVEYWSAHRAGREAILGKVVGRAFDLSRVQRRVREWRPDVIYVATSHNWPALLRDVLLALSIPRTGPPVVLHFHGSECDKLGDPGQGIFTSMSAWLARRVATVLLLSTEELEAWRRFCPGARFELVANPFVPPSGAGRAPREMSRAGSHEQSSTVLFVGRLVRDKGIFDLLDAFGIVRRSHACRLRIAGTGPAGPDVARRVALLGLSNDVDLLGYVSGDALDLVYRSADVVALPSYREGFPLVVMEAMAYGLPVVTTPIRGCLDHLIPGENALFAPPHDAEALSRRLLEALNDRALRRRMGDANLAKVQEFAPAAVVPRYAGILRGVASRRRNRVERCAK